MEYRGMAGPVVGNQEFPQRRLAPHVTWQNPIYMEPLRHDMIDVPQYPLRGLVPVHSSLKGSPMRTQKRVGVTVLLLLMSVATVIAMSPAHTFESAVQSTSVTNPGAAAMRIYLDSDGNVTSTPTDDAVMTIDPDMENLLRHDSEGLTTTTLPNGGVFINTEGRYGDVVVLRVGENGKQTVCVNGEKGYVNSLTDKTTPTGPEVK